MVTLKVGLAIWYHDIHLDTDSHFEVSWGWDGDIILTRSRISHHSLGTSSAPVWANFEQKWYAYHKSKQSMRSVQPKLCNSFMLCIYTYTKKKNNKKQCIKSVQPAIRCPLQYTFHHKGLSGFHTTTQQVLVWIEPPRFRPDTNVLQLTSSEHHHRQGQERLLMATAGNWWHVSTGINSSFYLL